MINNPIPFCQNLAKKSSDLILKRFNDTHKIMNKSTNDGLDIVTETDFEIEQSLKNLIKKKYPDHGFWGEENGGEFSEYTWVVDPLDGTNNFGIGLAIAGTSIALLRNGEPIIGIITYPFSNTYFIGIKGFGVYKNNSNKKYNPPKFIDQKRIAITVGNPTAASPNDHRVWLKKKLLLEQNYNRVMDLWCPVAGYYLLFTGALSNFISYKNEFYDLVAGYVIGKELELKLIDLNGDPYSYKKDDYQSFIMTRYTSQEKLENLLELLR